MGSFRGSTIEHFFLPSLIISHNGALPFHRLSDTGEGEGGAGLFAVIWPSRIFPIGH